MDTKQTATQTSVLPKNDQKSIVFFKMIIFIISFDDPILFFSLQGTTNQQGFGTKAIHAGQPPDPTSGSYFLWSFIWRSHRGIWF
jgi:hypothetical protein